MKIWLGVGTEHSMNLVMIGHFGDVGTAETAKDLIERLTAAVEVESAAGRLEAGEHQDRYSAQMLDLLGVLSLHSLAPDDLEQFLYEAQVRRTGGDVVVTTDEIEVSAFLKVMLDKGARVEVFSAHDHPDTGYGRGA